MKRATLTLVMSLFLSRDAIAQEIVASGATSAGAHLPRDLSVVGMFMAADLVVQGIMASLMLASVITWSVAIAKGIEILSRVRW